MQTALSSTLHLKGNPLASWAWEGTDAVRVPRAQILDTVVEKDTRSSGESGILVRRTVQHGEIDIPSTSSE